MGTTKNEGAENSLDGPDLRSILLETIANSGNGAARVAAMKELRVMDEAEQKRASEGPGSLPRDAIRAEIVAMSAQLGRKPLI